MLVRQLYLPLLQKGKIFFATKDWKEYEYQKDIETDPALQPVKQVGREVID